MKFVLLPIILASLNYSNCALAGSYNEDQAYKQATQQMQSQGRKIDQEINKRLTPEQRMVWCKEYQRKKQSNKKQAAQPVADKQEVLAEMTNKKDYDKEQKDLKRKLNNKNMSLSEQAALLKDFQEKINANTKETMGIMMADPAKRNAIIPQEGHATIAGVEDYLNESNCEGVTAEGPGGDDFGYDED